MERTDDRFDSLYEQYKSNTEVALEWVAETGRSLGYLPENQQASPGHRSRKRRRQGNPEIALRDLEGLALCIARHPTAVSIPRHVIWAIKDAISGRKRATAWKQRLRTSGRKTENDQRHGHFVSILENVLKHLEPLKEQPGEPKSQRVNDTKRYQAKKSPDQPTNLFQLLESQPLQVCDEQKASIGAKTEVLVAPHRTTHYRFRAEEEDEDEELYLFFYCLLQDLSDMRKAARLAWIRYRRRFSSLESAALVSHVAILLARNLEDGFWSHHASQVGRNEAMYDLFRRLQDMDVSGNSSTGASEAGLAIANMHELLTILHRRSLSLKDRKWPKSEDLSIVDSLLIPVRLQGRECDLLVKTFHCYRRYFNVQRKPKILDAFTDGLKDVFLAKTEQVVPIWLAFAAQLVIDQLSILSFGKEPSRAVLERTDVLSELHGSAEISLERERNNIDKHLDWMTDHVDMLYTDGDELTKRTNRVLECNPTLTGLHSLYGLISLQTLAFKLNKDGERLLPLAHLYHFLVKEGYSLIEWEDMELIINTHGVKHMFVGALPTEKSQYLSRLELASGFSITRWSKGNRTSNFYFSDKKRRRLNCTSTPVSLMFAKHLADSAASSPRGPFPLHRLELLLRSVGTDFSALHGKVDLNGNLPDEPSLVQKLRKVPRLTPGKLLLSLRTVLDREAPRLQMDHFEIDREYHAFLLKVHRVFLDKCPASKCECHDSNESVHTLDIVPDLMYAIPQYQYNNEADTTSAQNKQGVATLKAVAKEMEEFIKEQGHKQLCHILHQRPWIHYPRDLVGSNLHHEVQGVSNLLLVSEFHELQNAMLDELPFDPEIVDPEEWLAEIGVGDPPIINLYRWALHACYVVSVYQVAYLLSILIVIITLREQMSHKAVNKPPDRAPRVSHVPKNRRIWRR